MSEAVPTAEETDADKEVDATICACLNPAAPQSFFLYAGAGSGKTRSLINALNYIRETYGPDLWLRGKRVGVITYTNAASDEIKRRAKFDPLIEVSTIHSFMWSLIGGFNSDLREWLRVNLQREIEELEAAQSKGRSASKAAQQRARSLTSKRERLEGLDGIRVFTYSPTGDNRGRDALNHAEVISMGSAFITEKSALRRMLVSKYPILLIDESQDTNRHLIDALFSVQAEYQGEFCLGLFGDMMQRIYADGKAKLPELIPETWAKPSKKMNHRSPARIVRLINKVRSEADDHVQQNRADKPGGIARLFLASNEESDKPAIEQLAAHRMAEITNDERWKDRVSVKTLGLEHLMLARRMGFEQLLAPLFAVDRLKTGLLDGSLPGLRLFTHDVLPLVAAKQKGDQFLVAALMRKRSPLLHPSALKQGAANQPPSLQLAREAVDRLVGLWNEDAVPTCREVLEVVAETGLFELPEGLKAFVDMPGAFVELAAAMGEDQDDAEDDEGSDGISATLAAWDASLNAPITQAALYADYVGGASPFDTHQGVKGLEYPRVMVVIDDHEARGFMFSYEKLLGAKEMSSTDLAHERAGEETTIDRTRRLFYVTASRAEESLAVVAYSADKERVRESVLSAGWFEANEIELIAAPK